MPRPLNFAVVGLGMGGHHCTAVRNAKGAHLAAVCDMDEDRLAQRLKEFNCKGYLRYADVLEDPTFPIWPCLRPSRAGYPPF
jgi:predicted dehydrogenase